MKYPSLIAVLFLTACTPTSVDRLPAEEVLQRSARAAQEMQSARFELTADIKGEVSDTFDVSIRAEGILQDGGSSVEMSGAIEGTMNDEDLSLQGEMISVRGSALYFKIDTLDPDADVPLPIALVQPLLGQWLFVSDASQDIAAIAPTPDPQILHLQSQILTLEKDRGIRSIGDTTVYHFDVSVDPDRLAEYLAKTGGEEAEITDESVRGSVWIDAKTFALRAVEWEIRDLALPQGGISAGRIRIDFSEHNSAPLLTIPTNALPLVPGSFEGDDVLDVMFERSSAVAQ